MPEQFLLCYTISMVNHEHNRAVQILGVIAFLVVIIAIIILVQKKSVTDDGIEIPKVEITGNVEDLVAISLTPGQEVISPVTVSGSVRGAYFFEATARILTLDNAKEVVGQSYITATSEWMTSEPVAFSGTIETTYNGPGFIRIMEDDPSDGEGGAPHYFDVPVIFR